MVFKSLKQWGFKRIIYNGITMLNDAFEDQIHLKDNFDKLTKKPK